MPYGKTVMVPSRSERPRRNRQNPVHRLFLVEHSVNQTRGPVQFYVPAPTANRNARENGAVQSRRSGQVDLNDAAVMVTDGDWSGIDNFLWMIDGSSVTKLSRAQ